MYGNNLFPKYVDNDISVRPNQLMSKCRKCHHKFSKVFHVFLNMHGLIGSWCVAPFKILPEVDEWFLCLPWHKVYL